MPHATFPTEGEQEDMMSLAMAAMVAQKKMTVTSQAITPSPCSGPSARLTDSPLISSATRPASPAEPVTTKVTGWGSNAAAEWEFSGKPARTIPPSRKPGNNASSRNSSTPASASPNTTSSNETPESPQTTRTSSTTSSNNETPDSPQITRPTRSYADVVSCPANCAECLHRSTLLTLPPPTTPPTPHYSAHLMPIDTSNLYIRAEIAHHRHQDSRKAGFHGDRVGETVRMLEGTGRGRKEWEEGIWRIEDDVYEVIETEDGGREEKWGMDVDAWQRFIGGRRYRLEGTVLERRRRRR